MPTRRQHPAIPSSSLAPVRRDMQKSATKSAANDLGNVGSAVPRQQRSMRRNAVTSRTAHVDTESNDESEPDESGNLNSMPSKSKASRSSDHEYSADDFQFAVPTAPRMSTRRSLKIPNNNQNGPAFVAGSKQKSTDAASNSAESDCETSPVSNSRRSLRLEIATITKQYPDTEPGDSSENDVGSESHNLRLNATSKTANQSSTKKPKAVSTVRKRSTATDSVPTASTFGATMAGKIKKPSKLATNTANNSNAAVSPRPHTRRFLRRIAPVEEAESDAETAGDTDDAGNSSSAAPAISQSQPGPSADSSPNNNNGQSSSGGTSINSNVKLFKYPAVENLPNEKVYGHSKYIFGWCLSFEAKLSSLLGFARPTLYGYVVDRKKYHDDAEQTAASSATLLATTSNTPTQAYAVKICSRANNSDDDDDVYEERIPLKLTRTDRVASRESKSLIVCDNGLAYRLVDSLTVYSQDVVGYDEAFLQKFRDGFPINWILKCITFYKTAYREEQEYLSRKQQPIPQPLASDNATSDTVMTRRSMKQNKTSDAGDTFILPFIPPLPPPRRRPSRRVDPVVVEEAEIADAPAVVNEPDRAVSPVRRRTRAASRPRTKTADEAGIKTAEASAASSIDDATHKSAVSTESPCSLILSPPTSSSSPPANALQENQPPSSSNSRRSSCDGAAGGASTSVDAAATASQSPAASPARASSPGEEEGNVEQNAFCRQSDAGPEQGNLQASVGEQNDDDCEAETSPDAASTAEDITDTEQDSQSVADDLAAEDAVESAASSAEDITDAEQELLTEVEDLATAKDASESTASKHADEEVEVAVPPAEPVSIAAPANEAERAAIIEQLLDEIIETSIHTAAAATVDDNCEDAAGSSAAVAADEQETIPPIDESLEDSVVTSEEQQQTEVEKSEAEHAEQQPQLSTSPLPPSMPATDAENGAATAIDVAKISSKEATCGSPQRLPVLPEETVDVTPAPPPRHVHAESLLPSTSAADEVYLVDDSMANGVDGDQPAVTADSSSGIEEQPTTDAVKTALYEDISDDDDSEQLNEYDEAVLGVMMMDQNAENILAVDSNDEVEEMPQVDIQPLSNNSDGRNASCSASPPSAASPAMLVAACASQNLTTAVQQPHHNVYYATATASEPQFYDVNAALQNTAAYNYAQQQAAHSSVAWTQASQCAVGNFAQPVTAVGAQPQYYMQQQQSLPVLHVIDQQQHHQKVAIPMQVDDFSHPHMMPAEQQQQQQQPQPVFYDNWQVRHAPEIRQILQIPPPSEYDGDDFVNLEVDKRRSKVLPVRPLLPVLLPEFGRHYRCALDEHGHPQPDENYHQFLCEQMFAGKSKNFFGLYSSLYQNEFLQRSHSFARVRDIDPIDLESYVRQYVKSSGMQKQSTAGANSNRNMRKAVRNDERVEYDNAELGSADNADEDAQYDSDFERHRHYHQTLRPGRRNAGALRRQPASRVATNSSNATKLPTPSKRQLTSPVSSENSDLKASAQVRPSNTTVRDAGQLTPAVLSGRKTTSAKSPPRHTREEMLARLAAPLPTFKRQKTTTTPYSPRPNRAIAKKTTPAPVPAAAHATSSARAKKNVSFLRKSANQQPRVPISAVAAAAAAASDAVMNDRTTIAADDSTQYFSQQPDTQFSRAAPVSNGAIYSIQGRVTYPGGDSGFASSSNTNSVRFVHVESPPRFAPAEPIPMDVVDDNATNSSILPTANGINSRRRFASNTFFVEAGDGLVASLPKSSYYGNGVLPPVSTVVKSLRCVPQQPRSREQPLPSEHFFS